MSLDNANEGDSKPFIVNSLGRVFMVPGGGVEPPRAEARRILSLIFPQVHGGAGGRRIVSQVFLYV
jgi:hypothetical protein